MPKQDIRAQLLALERKHRFNYEVRQLCGPMLPNGIISIARQLLEENARLRQASEGLTGPHGMDAEHCPTFHDGCHCTVETLVYNIDRADAAEKALETVRLALIDAAEKAFHVGVGPGKMIKARHVTTVLEILAEAKS